MDVEAADRVETPAELAGLLHQLRRRQARAGGRAELSYRQIAARTGWGHGVIADYFSGRTLAPTGRFDELVWLLGATAPERKALATARDRIADRRRRPATPAPAPVPVELPPDVFAFTGRAGQLAQLERFTEGGRGEGAVPIVVITGTAGAGKTALAVRWAHRSAARFPDGQLHVDLRGCDPGRPLSAGQALGALLRSLGVTGADLPQDVAQRANCFRSMLAGRRVLILLDNANSVEQVRPLLPGTPSCCVIVTSRDDLAGLVARDGARRIELDALPATEAVDLLAMLIGDRVRAEPAAAAALAERCARLPLALRVAAELVASRAGEPIATLAGSLAASRLDLLDAGDDARTGVRATFSWSLRHLPDGTVATFALLGLHPGHDFDAEAIAALAGTDPAVATAELDRLERAHLVQRLTGGRYCQHNLLRAYARELTRPDRDALTRLFDHYLRSAAAAASTLDRSAGPGAFAESGQALAWLDAERANLVALSGHAAAGGWPAVSVALSRSLWRYLDVHGYYQEALAIHTDAATVAEPGGLDHAWALGEQGLVHWRLGRCELAVELLERALDLLRDGGSPAEEARTLAHLAIVCEQVGRYPDALARHGRALAIYRDIGDRRRQGTELGNLGALHYRLGDYRRALRCQQRAAEIGRDVADPYLEGYALANLGLVYQRLGRYADALASHRRGLAAAREYGDRRGEAEMLRSLGVTHARLAAFAEAADHLEHALALTRELGNRTLEAETLNDLGETRRAMAEPAAALAAHEQAYAIASDAGDPHEQARALDGAGHALRDTGRAAEARRRWRAALALYAGLGLPEAGQVRVNLAGSGKPLAQRR